MTEVTEMFLKIHVFWFGLLMYFPTVGRASITINPSSMVVGSSSANPATRVEVLCNSDGVNNIEVVFRLEISRRRFNESNFASIAGVDAYKITKSFPADMKSPNATGSLVSMATGEPPTSGTLVVTMDGGGLTCSDQAEFKCSMTYKMMGVETRASSDSNNFTVITAPNDVRIMDALYEENGIQLQLANDSKLNVGTRIKYRCTANIGSDSSVLISWERSPVMGTSTDLVPYIPAESTDIVQDPVVSTSCSNTRTSSMYYNMTNSDDDGVTFRCKVRSYLSGNWYESISIPRRTFAVLSSGTSKPTLQPGSSDNNSSVLAAVLGVVVGASVILIVILSLFLHRSHKLTKELQSQLQSRSHTYDGLMGTVTTSEPYAILNLEPTENHLQSNYLNPYDRLNRKVGNSEPYDMLESHHSDANVHH